ncbi:MAG: hypothetical protein J07HQX50_00813 [Haloquadratum sp. J07HQX50]|nr:MAG: hypothetical protein J07HQX50_00813 [Haloquadratum sp. J07HQX50]
MEWQWHRRPWLAVLLGVFVTGLGHVYLRRWGRGLTWFLLTIAATALFLPDATPAELLAGGGDPVQLAPALVVGIASLVDVYLQAHKIAEQEASPDKELETTNCPECGKELDDDLGFCSWCTTELNPDARE